MSDRWITSAEVQRDYGISNSSLELWADLRLHSPKTGPSPA